MRSLARVTREARHALFLSLPEQATSGSPLRATRRARGGRARSGTSTIASSTSSTWSLRSRSHIPQRRLSSRCRSSTARLRRCTAAARSASTHISDLSGHATCRALASRTRWRLACVPPTRTRLLIRPRPSASGPLRTLCCADGAVVGCRDPCPRGCWAVRALAPASRVTPSIQPETRARAHRRITHKDASKES